jgi:hypothetical protein
VWGIVNEALMMTQDICEYISRWRQCRSLPFRWISVGDYCQTKSSPHPMTGQLGVISECSLLLNALYMTKSTIELEGAQEMDRMEKNVVAVLKSGKKGMFRVIYFTSFPISKIG